MASKIQRVHNCWCSFNCSVADLNPDPDPPNPHVFGPPGSGSGSISQRYGSGSSLTLPLGSDALVILQWSPSSSVIPRRGSCGRPRKCQLRWRFRNRLFRFRIRGRAGCSGAGCIHIIIRSPRNLREDTSDYSLRRFAGCLRRRRISASCL